MYVNKHYTNLGNLSEFRIDVTSEMAELDQLLDSGLGSNFTPNHHVQQPYHNRSQNKVEFQQPENQDNFPDTTEFQQYSHSTAVTRNEQFKQSSFDNSNMQQNLQSEQLSQYLTSSQFGDTHWLGNKQYSEMFLGLQKDVTEMNARLNRIEKLLQIIFPLK